MGAYYGYKCINTYGPSEVVHEASNPKIWVLGLKGNGSHRKGYQSDNNTRDGTGHMGKGKDD